MTVQEMALRNEVRQMMCEAGFNRETIKNEVKSLVKEVIAEATKQAIAETNVESIVHQFIEKDARRIIEDKVANEVFNGLRYNTKNVDIKVCINGDWWKESEGNNANSN